jgi:hypothetical protein
MRKTRIEYKNVYLLTEKITKRQRSLLTLQSVRSGTTSSGIISGMSLKWPFTSSPVGLTPRSVWSENFIKENRLFHTWKKKMFPNTSDGMSVPKINVDSKSVFLRCGPTNGPWTRRWSLFCKLGRDIGATVPQITVLISSRSMDNPRDQLEDTAWMHNRTSKSNCNWL